MSLKIFKSMDKSAKLYVRHS